MTISAVVADDQALVRSGFTVLVKAASDMTVLGEAGTAPTPSAWSASTVPTSC